MVESSEVSPRRILDGRGGFARTSGVSIVLLDLPEWQLADAEQLFAETMRDGAPSSATLTLQLGGLPNAAVRRRMAELQAELERGRPRTEQKVALLVDSAISRGAITAWRWLTGASTRAFHRSSVEAAAAWLVDPGVDPAAIVSSYHETLALVLPAGSRARGA